MFDVFLSHNRQQKPWVRRLYRFLDQHRLKVFFDEESVAPGQNVVTAIERGLESSKRVLLVLSRSSLASPWVAMETQLAIHTDPAAEAGKVIPVMVENVDFKDVRLGVRALNCIDLCPRGSRESRLRFLLRHLGLPDADALPTRDLDGLLSLADDYAEPALQVADIDDVLKWGWDGRRLLEALIELDYATTDDLTPAHEGDPGQWAPVFMNHPETWRLLTDGPEKVVGYWHTAPLFPREYELAKAGRLLDSQITLDTTPLFELPGEYDLYVVQVCMHPAYRRPRNVQLLFETFFEVLDRLSANGSFVRDVTANAFTPVGVSLCRTFNMTLLGDHSQRGAIYSAPIRDVLRHSFAERFPQLKDRYVAKGLL